MITGLRPIPFQHYGPAHRLGRAGVGEWGTFGRGWVGLLPTLWNPQRTPSSDPASPAHLPPQGKAIGKPCVAYVENYQSNHPHAPKHVGFPSGGKLSAQLTDEGAIS